MADRIPIEMSQKILEYLKKETQWDWVRIADFIGITEKTVHRIKKGEVGLYFQQFLNIVDEVGIDILSCPEDASPELKDQYQAYRFLVQE